MSKFALVMSGGISDRVHEVRDHQSECFEVHASMEWITCPDEITTNHFHDETGFKDPIPSMTNVNTARKVHYDEVGAQLDMLYHAHIAGDENPLATWAAEQTKIKELFPKDNEAAMNYADKETARRVQLLVDPDTNRLIDESITPNMRRIALELHDDLMSGVWVNPHL